MKRLHLLLLGLALVLSFAIFSRYIKRGGLKEIDFAVTVKLQERIDNSSRLRLARLTGEVMEGATFFASPLISVIAIIIITFITLFKRKKWRMVALAIPLIFGLMTLAEIYGKSVVHHPAPPFFLLKNPTTVFPKYYVWEDFSYPSGHAARAIFLAVTSFFLFPFSFFQGKRLWIFIALGGYVILISVSRIYLGHHWLSDVLAGLLLGAGSGLLTSALILPYNTKRNE
ncbi:phosphatase PAP2 family protein [Candidatus Gottesmanbacteria bacterium]|nr:phosphatase PAP2 family protein [Candidatus Gottesmanbacteria bacterium]